MKLSNLLLAILLFPMVSLSSQINWTELEEASNVSQSRNPHALFFIYFEDGRESHSIDRNILNDQRIKDISKFYIPIKFTKYKKTTFQSKTRYELNKDDIYFKGKKYKFNPKNGYNDLLHKFNAYKKLNPSSFIVLDANFNHMGIFKYENGIDIRISLLVQTLKGFLTSSSLEISPYDKDVTFSIRRKLVVLDYYNFDAALIVSETFFYQGTFIRFTKYNVHYFNLRYLNAKKKKNDCIEFQGNKLNENSSYNVDYKTDFSFDFQGVSSLVEWNINNAVERIMQSRENYHKVYINSAISHEFDGEMPICGTKMHNIIVFLNQIREEIPLFCSKKPKNRTNSNHFINGFRMILRDKHLESYKFTKESIINEFKNTSNNSEKYKTCDRCGGDGTINCDDHDTNYNGYCTTCKNSNFRECYKCFGMGKIK